MIKENIDVKM